MLKLLVKQNGKTLSEISLSEEKEYVAGRGDTADISLGDSKQISRQHFKLSFRDASWNIDFLSKYGELLVNGESATSAALKAGDVFSTSGFDFFIVTEKNENKADVLSDNVEAQVSHELILSPENAAMTGEPMIGSSGLSSDESYSGDLEKTNVGTAPQSAFMRVNLVTGDVHECELIGPGPWIGGREANNDIHVSDARVSRRQFEVSRRGENYYIVDLGSANGTLLNDDSISTVEPMSLKSGDIIGILENRIVFEIRDPSFQSRAEVAIHNVQDLAPLDASAMMPPPVPDAQMLQYSQYAGRIEGGAQPSLLSAPAGISQTGSADKKTKIIRLALFAVILIGAAVYILQDDNAGKPAEATKKVAPTVQLTPAQKAFQALTQEKQNFVKQTYTLALSYRNQGKYRSAKDELIKIHQYVPEYENSSMVEKELDIVLAQQEELARIEEEERRKKEIQDKIDQTVQRCKKLILPNVVLEEVDKCLAPALEFDPANAQLLDVRRAAEQILQDKKAKEAEKKEIQNKLDKIRSEYRAILAKASKQSPLQAIKTLQTFFATTLPDPDNLKGKIRDKIAEIKESIARNRKEYENKSEEAVKAGDLKKAILTLEKATEIDPQNAELRHKIEDLKFELKKQLQPTYQESVLEESVGDVDKAKEKWKKILEKDVPSGEYYIKASTKLRKYGDI